MKIVRYSTWKEWAQMMIVHVVSLIDPLVGLVTLGTVDTELRPTTLFQWFVELHLEPENQ